MAGRQRRIYFFEPVEIDSNERISTFDDTFWPSLHEHVATLGGPDGDPDRLRMRYLGNKYSGAARTEKSPSEDFFYIGKARPGSDWPDVELPNTGTTPLSFDDPDARLVEPAYLLPVRGTPYVAALRTSGGPTWSAVQNWLGAVSGRVTQHNRFELRPYVRTDQLERLQGSLGVTRLHLKVDPGAGRFDGLSGELAESLKKAEDLGAGAMSIEIGLSFGRARPEERAAEDIARQVERLITNVKFSSADAKIMTPDDSPRGYTVEDLDFYKDRVTGHEYVGTSEDEVPTAGVVLKAMTQAIRKFRESLAR